MQVMSKKKLAPEIFPFFRTWIMMANINGNCVVKLKTIVARGGIEITKFGYND